MKKGKDGARKEAKQLNGRTLRKPAHPNNVTKNKKYKDMESLALLLEKRDGTTKGQVCTNGST